MPKVDMSDKAVTNRLKRVSQLRRLALSLGTAKINKAPTKKNETLGAGHSNPNKLSEK